MDSGAALVAALVALLLPCVARGFFPNGLDRCDSRDASHESMTAAALVRVAAALGFADESQLWGTSSYRDALQTIVAANEAVGGAEWWQAVMHFNAEQLTEANEYLADTRDLAALLITNSSMPDYVLVRQLVGRCLHLVQDFYSNTNWFEQYSLTPSDTYQKLGVRGTVIPVDESPCLSADPSGMNVNNIFYSKRPFRLTSGFRGGQDKAKPEPNGRGPQGERKGKCSHGGAQDSSAVLEPRGGINKESSADSLSPHSIDHDGASQLATLATVEFFIHPESGLLRRIGKDKLLKVLGLQPSARLTLLVNSSSDWLGSGSSSAEDRSAALHNLAEALFGSTHGVRLHGVRISCDSSKPVFDSASELYTALLYGEPGSVMTDRSVMEQCLIGQPERSAILVIFDTEIWLTQPREIDWWRTLASKRSIKIFIFMKQGIAITNPGAVKQLRDMCFNTGGGLYDFTDAEDLTQQMTLVPYRVSAVARELHPLPRVVMLSPNHTVIAESDCINRPYTSVQMANWSSAAVATKELWSPSTMRLEEVRFSQNVATKLHLQDSNCSARLLQTMPYITLELYEKGPYSQLFASSLTARGRRVRAVVRITSAASTATATYTVRVRNGYNFVGTNQSSNEYKTASCRNANSARGTSYIADISLDATESIISVVDGFGFELLNVPSTVPRVRLVGPAYVTDTSQLTIMNLGQAAATAMLRVVSENGNMEAVALSESRLRLEPNASSTVKLLVKSHRLADCAQWWLARPLGNCTCSLETRSVIIHLSTTDEAGNTEADILPVTVIQCVTAATDAAASSSTKARSTPAVTTARETATDSPPTMTTMPTTTTTRPASSGSPLPPTGLTSRIDRLLSTGNLTLESGQSSADATTTTASSRRLQPTAVASTAQSPAAFASVASTDRVPATWEESGTENHASSTSAHTVAEASSAASLRLLGITLACTVGILLLFVLSLGGILYMKQLFGTKRFERPKDKDEGMWLREEQP